jgi:hypothetical protein
MGKVYLEEYHKEEISDIRTEAALMLKYRGDYYETEYQCKLILQEAYGNFEA